MKQDVHERGIAAVLGNLADGFSRLVTQHLALAKLELREDVKALGRNAAAIIAGVPFVLVGYTLLMAALAALLRRWVGWGGGFAIVGGFNVLVGAIAIAVGISKLGGRQVMGETSRELQRTSTALAAAKAAPASPSAATTTAMAARPAEPPVPLPAPSTLHRTGGRTDVG